jgi:hypothetical protein
MDLKKGAGASLMYYVRSGINIEVVHNMNSPSQGPFFTEH